MGRDPTTAPGGPLPSAMPAWEDDGARVAGPDAVAALLWRLIDQAAPLAVSAPDGSSCTATLWTVDPARGRLSLSADPHSPQLQALLDVQEAAVVTCLDQVRLQFELGSLVLVHAARSCALQADLPGEVFSCRRRSARRVHASQRTAPTARLRHPAMPEMQLALRVIDISLGGCALALPGDVPPLPAGVRLQGVRLELDNETAFDAVLQLQHVLGFNPAGGLRLGCAFGPLAPDAERALRRYIDQTQQRRRRLPG